MNTVRLYSKEDCHLCEEAKAILDSAATRAPLKVEVVDIKDSPAMEKMFGEHVPVADFGEGRRLYWPFETDDVLLALNGAVPTDQLVPEDIGEGLTLHWRDTDAVSEVPGMTSFVSPVVFRDVRVGYALVSFDRSLLEEPTP